MIFLIIFVLVPVVELYFMLEVGDAVGAFNTVFLVILTALIGGFMVRQQGFSTLMRMRETAARGEMPAIEIFESAILFLCGVMLLLPGFITDTLGFLLLIRPVRQALILKVMQNRSVQATYHTQAHSSESDEHVKVIHRSGHRVIEVDDYKKED
ncbi:MAG: FxsA family protein [Gammaproteobacteria bacterium]|jgi:UPF0716 protein FxsA